MDAIRDASGTRPKGHSPVSATHHECPDHPASPAIAGPLGSALDPAIARTRTWLLEQQKSDGHWVAELEGDTILESEYILLLAFLGEHDSQTARKAARYLLEKQLPEGGWTSY